MRKLFFTTDNELKTSFLEIAIIVLLALVPLFTSFPYRVNIFLSWEGAYRMSQGEIPYKDFGIPLGYMYWVVPAIFFKIFGVQMISLVKAQVFLNIISGLAFRSILKSLKVQPGIRLLSVILYCISFSFFNFWPWYNHTVFVYEFVALAFLLKYIMNVKHSRYSWLWLVASAVFTFFSFFTKQDGGALAFLLCGALLLYHCIHEKKWLSLLIYSLSLAAIAAIIIVPLTTYSFGYWFNHGQAPHQSRFSLFEIIDEFFYNSLWIKFYIFLSGLLVFFSFKKWKDLWQNKRTMVFLLLTMGILAEAAIIQVTSYTPPDNNIFFHSFAFAFILTMLASIVKINFSFLKPFMFAFLGLMLWWSGIFWKYFQRIMDRMKPETALVQQGGENIVTRSTYKIDIDSTNVPDVSQWKFTNLPVFKKIFMPQPTVEGIERLMNMDAVKSNPGLRMLNMSELTPLAAAIPYKLEKGLEYPLWYHLGVSMFNKQAAMFEKKIADKEYDVILFQYMPSLNNFYPFRIRDSIKAHYKMVDSFLAPRRGKETKGDIEVYVK